MDELTNSERYMVSDDQVKKLIHSVCEQLLLNIEYSDITINQHQRSLVDTILYELHQLNKPYKYLLTCILQQSSTLTPVNTIHTSTSVYYDSVSDICITTVWPLNKKNITNQYNGISAIITVAAVSFYTTV